MFVICRDCWFSGSILISEFMECLYYFLICITNYIRFDHKGLLLPLLKKYVNTLGDARWFHLMMQHSVEIRNGRMSSTKFLPVFYGFSYVGLCLFWIAYGKTPIVHNIFGIALRIYIFKLCNCRNVCRKVMSKPR